MYDHAFNKDGQSVAEIRWDMSARHRLESVRLVEMLCKLDIHSSGSFEMGGDGDVGEDLAYFLDELIETGKVVITFPE